MLIFYIFNDKLWDFSDFFGWFIELSVQTFKPLIFIYRRGNLVYHRPVSYPLDPWNNLVKAMACRGFFRDVLSMSYVQKIKIAEKPETIREKKHFLVFSLHNPYFQSLICFTINSRLICYCRALVFKLFFWLNIKKNISGNVRKQ